MWHINTHTWTAVHAHAHRHTCAHTQTRTHTHRHTPVSPSAQRGELVLLSELVFCDSEHVPCLDAWREIIITSSRVDITSSRGTLHHQEGHYIIKSGHYIINVDITSSRGTNIVIYIIKSVGGVEPTTVAIVEALVVVWPAEKDTVGVTKHQISPILRLWDNTICTHLPYW